MENRRSEDVSVSFESGGEDNAYRWEDDTLIVSCAKGTKCKITVSADDTVTTFGVSNPFGISRTYLSALHNVGKLAVNARAFFFRLYLVFYRMVN